MGYSLVGPSKKTVVVEIETVGETQMATTRQSIASLSSAVGSTHTHLRTHIFHFITKFILV